MNRSILIVICDFLLLSLLTFSTDINRIADDDTQRSAKVDVVTNAVVEPGQDLAAVMKLALAEERKGHEQLQQQLTQARSEAGQQQAQLVERERENSRLQEQFTAAQSNIEGLNHELLTNSVQAQETQQKLVTVQAQEQKESDLAAELRRQLDELNKSNQLALTEKQGLANQLQSAEEERRIAAERATLLQQEVQATRSENAKLAEGFQTLATNSSQLTQEIRDNRALAPNTIFSDFVSNRLEATVLASRPTFLGFGGNSSKNAKTILATDGKNIIALCHVQDTPLDLRDPGTDWNQLTGTIMSRGAQVAIQSLSFHQQDPRVVMMPVTPSGAQQLGGKIYRISSDPYKFQDAVLVGADEGYYGECNFQIDLSTPNYLKLDHNLLKGLFGKFNPSRGDLVFSRTGELLGIMVNSTYCLTIHDFAASATLPFNQDLSSQHTGATLARLYDYIFQLPLRLQ